MSYIAVHSICITFWFLYYCYYLGFFFSFFTTTRNAVKGKGTLFWFLKCLLSNRHRTGVILQFQRKLSLTTSFYFFFSNNIFSLLFFSIHAPFLFSVTMEFNFNGHKSQEKKKLQKYFNYTYMKKVYIIQKKERKVLIHPIFIFTYQTIKRKEDNDNLYWHKLAHPPISPLMRCHWLFTL